MTDENKSEEFEKPKLTLVGGGSAEEDQVQEEELDEIPTVAAQAVKVIYPMFMDPTSGRPLPPPPNHEFRLGVQVSITTEGRVLQESPGIFFVSGNNLEEMADAARDIILQGLQSVKRETSPIITPDQLGDNPLETLKKFGIKSPGDGS